MAIEDTDEQLGERITRREGELAALRQEHTLLRENVRRLLKGLADDDEGKAGQVLRNLKREDFLGSRLAATKEEAEAGA